MYIRLEVGETEEAVLLDEAAHRGISPEQVLQEDLFIGYWPKLKHRIRCRPKPMPPVGRPPLLTKEEQESIVRAYCAGSAPALLAAEHGVSLASILRLIPGDLKRVAGRPPMSPEAKECRRLYQTFASSYLHQRERLPPEVFDRIHGRFYSFLESHAEDYAVLLWFQKEHPWTLEPQALETLALPETTPPPSDTNKEQLETKEVTTR